jgi:uncharacterized iron-regulated membrane protein
MFQIHLWGGILLCLYCVLIGVSGSLLVFEDALGRLSYPHLMGPDRRGNSAPSSSLDTISDTIRAAAPGWDLTTLYTPGVRGSNYSAVLARDGKYQYVFASARDGHVLGHQKTRSRLAELDC